MIMDISTCAIAEGKIKVARERNETIPENAIIDGNGLPTTSPQDFYDDPPGVLLPIAGHKSFALSLVCGGISWSYLWSWM
jgi:LDH2 family malate/lactate/ureidoglycolate dehydrogenase